MMPAAETNSRQYRICLYCKRSKHLSEFSEEHVIPRAVTGYIPDSGNPFIIHNVCANCNNLCGLFVDSAFIKSWFRNNHRASYAREYCNLTDKTVLPLKYMGALEELQQGDCICEFWFGPTGDTVYHFHKPYPEKKYAAAMAGIPPYLYKQDIDKGFVFLFLRSNNPLWHPVILFSVLANFRKGTPIYFGNADPVGVPGCFPIPDHLRDLHLHLKSVQNKEHKATITISIDYETRFLCKLALGLGYLHLGDEFLHSKSADRLRKVLWTVDFQKRQELEIRGTNMFDRRIMHPDLDPYFRWEGGHFIGLILGNDQLILNTNFYNSDCSMIEITDEKNLWEGKIGDGMTYVVTPALNKVAGPVEFKQYILHRTFPEQFPESAVAKLQEELRQPFELPPFEI